MKKSEFLADVAHEIQSLKTNATSEELARLNVKKFNPVLPETCIYGQLTRDCASMRARELMDKGCKRVWHVGDFGVDELNKRQYLNVKKFINGEYTGQLWSSMYGRSYNYLSALEGYICLKDAKIQHIIDYLKGDVEVLNLK